jgi:hypothetical protein
MYGEATMLDNAQSNASAKVSQEIKYPDFFSCRNCKGWEWSNICRELRQNGDCAKQMLRQSLASGAVQVVLYAPAQLPGGRQ